MYLTLEERGFPLPEEPILENGESNSPSNDDLLQKGTPDISGSQEEGKEAMINQIHTAVFTKPPWLLNDSEGSTREPRRRMVGEGPRPLEGPLKKVKSSPAGTLDQANGVKTESSGGTVTEEALLEWLTTSDGVRYNILSPLLQLSEVGYRSFVTFPLCFPSSLV